MSKVVESIGKILPPIANMYVFYRSRVILKRHNANTGINAAPLAKFERDEIDAAYAPYGLLTENRYFVEYAIIYHVTGLRSPRFLDSSIFNRITSRFNNFIMRPAWTDKCYTDVICRGFRTPHAILRNINGVLFDHGFKEITIDMADRMLKEERGVVVKPSIDSFGGSNVRFYDNPVFSEISSAYGINYIIQRHVRQHRILSNLNPSSLNTFRVITWRFQGETHILSFMLRVGAEGSCVDNITFGGRCYSVSYEGRTGIKSFSKDNYLVVEKDQKEAVIVPSFGRVLECAKEAHKLFPHFGIIAWDIALDAEEEPVIIEYNVGNIGNSIQFVSGPILGTLWSEVLKEAGNRGRK